MATEEFLRIMEKQMTQQQQLIEQQAAQVKELTEALKSGAARGTTPAASTAWPAYTAFDSTQELWTDYLERFKTFLTAHSIPQEKAAHVFLTTQTATTYKLLSNLANQQTPPKEVNRLTMTEIETFMMDQYNPKRFVVRERFRFWSHLDRKPVETIPELVSRIRHEAATCDFRAIKDPLDDAMLTRFMCSVSNEAVLKALFKVSADELHFSKAVEIAMATEDAAKVAKETTHGASSVTSLPVHQTRDTKGASAGNCKHCGKAHKSECKYKDAACNYCGIKGHLEKICRKKARSSKPKKVKTIVKSCFNTSQEQTSCPELRQKVVINGHSLEFEIDTGSADNFMGQSSWRKIGSPTLQPSERNYQSASQHPLPVLGTVALKTHLKKEPDSVSLDFNVTQQPDLNLLGRTAITQLGISVDSLLQQPSDPTSICTVMEDQPDLALQDACRKVCEEFPNLFKPELGKLKNFELEVKFKDDVKPVFCKPRNVPYAIQEDLVQAYEAGIKRGVWERTQFNDFGTPVVPIRKTPLPGQATAKLRVCGDYSSDCEPSAGAPSSSNAFS